MDDGSNSIIKVTAEFGTDTNDGHTLATCSTGFIYGHGNTAVTTLHSVAGSSRILVYSEVSHKTFLARKIKVLRTADLALLEIQGDFNLPTLHATNVSPNSNAAFKIWGYPFNEATMQSNNMSFSQGKSQNPTLTDIIGDQEYQKLLNQMKIEGYPDKSCLIERLGDIIDPGHSGAPVFNTGGQVVGVADGGLHGGFARINWAIKADPYLQELLASNDNGQTAPKSMLTELYSFEIDADRNEIAPPEVVIKDNYNQKMSKTWVKTLSELVNSLPASEIQDPLNAMNKYQNVYPDIKDIQVQVYEDFKTGFTLAIPAGGKFYVDSQTGYFVIEAGFEKEYYQMLRDKDSNSLVQAADAFDGKMRRLNSWILPLDAYSERKTVGGLFRIGRDMRTSDSQVYH